MSIMVRQKLLCLTLLLSVTGCGDRAKLPVTAGFGPAPTLPSPNQTLIPTIKVATATRWPTGAQPAATPGLAVASFAIGLDHPRWLYLLPNGDVLVAETAGPAAPGRRQRA
jgi:glucose/arabinose dehydrogenase